MSNPRVRRRGFWGHVRDRSFVTLAVVCAFLTASSFDLTKRWQSIAGRFEYLEADEIPMVLFILAGFFGVLGWRRVRRSYRALEGRRRREATLVEQKVEAIALFASGTAHDLSNLLFAIDIFASRSEDGSETLNQQNLSGIRDATQRGRDVIAKLKGLADPPTELKGLSLNNHLRDLEPLLRSLLPDPTVLRYELAGTLPEAWADPTSFAQILLNLVSNARDASNAGDPIEISSASIDTPEGRRVRIRVRDSGVGIEARAQARIFDPSFTTKPAGKGSGLGLALVQALVAQQGASIEAQSEPGSGSTFDVYFRAVGEAPPRK